MKKTTLRMLLIAYSFILCLGTSMAQEINPDMLYKLASPSGLVIDNKESRENNSKLFLARNDKNAKGQLWKLVSVGETSKRIYQ